jgi:hypothetical protein
MKARFHIVGALLFAFLFAPSAQRLWGSPLSASPCHDRKPLIHSRGRVPSNLTLSRTAHQHPATRMHRIRGKKINVQDPVPAASLSCVSLASSAPAPSPVPHDLDGPNPSRGPPPLYLEQPSQFELWCLQVRCPSSVDLR